MAGLASLGEVGISVRRVEAVVFDLLFTLVHPGTYPGGTGRVGWMANMLGVDAAALGTRWAAFEPVLEAGRAKDGADGLGPELAWVRAVAAELGVAVSAGELARIDADWDLTRRVALLDPPPSTIAALVALRERGIRLGVLSNTHARELRAWDRSPLAALVDVVAFSHEIGACKPDPATYAHVLGQLGVHATAAAFVGDGSSDELLGARAAGFGLVILAEEAPSRWAAEDLPRLRAQSDVSVVSLVDVVAHVDGGKAGVRRTPPTR
jgi:putative hydrolase of the HAD superfamily